MQRANSAPAQSALCVGVSAVWREKSTARAASDKSAVRIAGAWLSVAPFPYAVDRDRPRGKTGYARHLPVTQVATPPGNGPSRRSE